MIPGFAKLLWRRIFALSTKLPVPNSVWAAFVSFPYWVVSRTTIHYDGKVGLFCVKDSSGHLYVARRSRLDSYILGIDRRLSLLSSEYGFDDLQLATNGLSIDVGSNIGEVAKILGEMGQDVLAFEPDPEEFWALTQNAGKTTRHFQVALGADNGTARLYLSNSSGDSSLIEPTSFAGTLDVKVASLDALLEAEGLGQSPVEVLKLEAEGAEPEVLLGARHALRRTKWVVADVGFERGTAQLSTLPEVVNFLLDLRFEVVKVLPGRLVVLLRNKDVG